MPVRNTFLFVLAIAAIIVGVIFYLNGEPNYPAPKNQTIVAFGDSLVEGVGSTAGNDFVSVINRKLGTSIINKGNSGDTTQAALDRIGEVLNLDPGIVVIVLGGNDYLRRVTKETTFSNLETIIKKFQENGTVVVLFGTRGGLIKDNYESDYRNLAKKLNVVYLPNILEDILGNRALMADQIHPNDAGYIIIAERLAPVLKKILAAS